MEPWKARSAFPPIYHRHISCVHQHKFSVPLNSAGLDIPRKIIAFTRPEPPAPRHTMNRSMQRRHFLQTGALAIGALCTSLPCTAQAAEQMALGFIGKYSDRFIIQSEGGPTMRLIALVQDLPRLSEAFFRSRAAGISDLRASGTRVTFRADGQLFEVENLMQQDFAARLSEQSGNLPAVNA